MVVRGAPAIGVAGAYGLALAASRGEDLDAAYDVLAAARPTAANLVWALDVMRDDPTPERARALHGAEVERCRRMAAHAVELFEPGSRVLTHCNAGGLATGGYGTAVGAIRRAWEDGLVAHVWVDETRPLLQGSRLTAWELERLGVPFAGAARLRGGGADGRGRGRLRRHRRRPHRGQRRHGEQDRHLRARGPRGAPRDPAVRRGAHVDRRPRHADREPGSRSRSATRPR